MDTIPREVIIHELLPHTNPSDWEACLTFCSRQELLAAIRSLPEAALKSALRWAAEHGSEFVFSLVIEDGRVSPDSNLLSYASSNGHLNIMELLLSYPEIDPSIDNNTALQNAAINGHIDIVKLLLQDSRVVTQGITSNLLIDTGFAGHIEIVCLLESYHRRAQTLNTSRLHRIANDVKDGYYSMFD